jgi:hypothetical protein
MPIGFPAYHEGSACYDCSLGELMDAIDDAIDSLKWNGSQVKRRRWTASTPMNLFSWGEKITIDIEEDCRVFVRSEYAFPLAWLDWGHNSSNVRRFLNKLDGLLGDREDERDEDY